MKVNWDFYKENNEEKDELLNTLEKKVENIEEAIAEADDINVIYALSNIRENILSWYPFDENKTILQLGNKYGEITKLLCKKSKNVVSIINNKYNAEFIKKRHNKIENLELVVGEIKNIILNAKYDYIVVEEYKNYLENVEFIKTHLEPNGKVIIMFDNFMGVNKLVNLSENIITEKSNIKPNLDILSIEEKLENDGFVYKKFYYPFPDYKLPNIIYTDKYVPTEDNLSRNLRYKEYIYSLNENKVLKYILKLNNNYLKIVSNSFLIEMSQEQFDENCVKAVFFTNQRKENKRICTIMCNDKVYKYSNQKNNKEHLEQVKQNIDIIKDAGLKTLDSYDEEKIISNLCNEKSFDKMLMEKFHNNGTEELIANIKEFFENIKAKLQEGSFENNVFDRYDVEYDKEKFSKLHYLKHGLWDLCFQNCFYVENDYYFYDQEWIEENVPIEYIIYRAIFYFGEIKKYNVESKLYEEMGITDYLDEFKKLDDKIQENIRNTTVWKWHLKSKEANLYIDELKNEINNLRIENARLSQEHEKNKIEFENVKNSLNYKENQIIAIHNSTSWKLTKPLREIRSIFNKRKKS